jgi:hypothetical protein
VSTLRHLGRGAEGGEEVSDGTITRRDTRNLEEGARVLDALGDVVRDFADRMPPGAARRSAGRETEAALRETAEKVKALRQRIPDADVRL